MPAPERPDARRDDTARDNRRLVAKLGVIVLAMFGFGYALVPFYEKICEVTGLRNIAQADAVANTQVDMTRSVRVEFDTNLRNMPWKFRALEPATDVHPGAVTTGAVRGRQHDRSRDHRAGDSELRAARSRAILPQARLLLFREADARGRGNAADARRVRRRSGAAEGSVDDHAFVYVLPGRGQWLGSLFRAPDMTTRSHR